MALKFEINDRIYSQKEARSRGNMAQG